MKAVGKTGDPYWCDSDAIGMEQLTSYDGGALRIPGRDSLRTWRLRPDHDNIGRREVAVR